MTDHSMTPSEFIQFSSKVKKQLEEKFTQLSKYLWSLMPEDLYQYADIFWRSEKGFQNWLRNMFMECEASEVECHSSIKIEQHNISSVYGFTSFEDVICKFKQLEEAWENMIEVNVTRFGRHGGFNYNKNYVLIQFKIIQ